MADLNELFARLAKQGVTSPDVSGQAPHYHQPSVSSPVYTPSPSGPQPHHQSAIMSPNTSVANTPAPEQSSSDKTASLLNLLRFNGLGASQSASASDRRPSQQPVQNLSAAEGQAAHGRAISASDLVASFMRKPSQGASYSPAAAPPAPSGRADQAPLASEAPQDLLLRLLNHPKPPQTDLPVHQRGRSSHLPEMGDEFVQAAEEAKPTRLPSDTTAVGSQSPIRIFGDNPPGDSAFEVPQPAPKGSMFTYVNPFEQLSAATPRNRTPVPERAVSAAAPRNRTPLPDRANTTATPRKMEILKPKHGRDISAGLEGKENGSDASGPASKTRKLSPGATSHIHTHQPHETVSEAVSGIGEQVDKQVEEALAQAVKQSNGNVKAKAKVEDMEIEELEVAIKDAAISIKKELDDPETGRDMEATLPKPMADALKEVVEEVATADVVDSWESAEAEDSPAKDEDQQIQVFKFPMKAFAAITIQSLPDRCPSFRQSTVMDIARLKKEFDQIDRSLVTATKAFIVYALAKNGGFRIIRQDNGQFRQVFQNYKERIFNLASCSASPADGPLASRTPQTILGIGVNGAVFWAAVNTKDDEIELIEDHSIIFPPAAARDDNTSGGQLKTRAKPSCRHPEFFAVGRGKAIHIVYPEVARLSRYTDMNTQICDTEAYLKDRSLKILTGKAGKDFAFSEDDTVIVSLDKAGRMRFWDIRPLTQESYNDSTSEIEPVEVKEPIWEFHTTSTNAKSWPTSVFFFDKERPCVKGIALRYVMVGMKQNHSFQLWDLGLGKAVQEINLPHEKESDAICSVAFHPKTGVLVVGHPTRNSIFFIHVSCPRYNLPVCSQASYISRLAKKEAVEKPLPPVNATAIMTSIHEYSFASKGQLRSLQMLNEPVSSSPDDKELHTKPRFELYVMHSKGVSAIAVRQADLGWKNDGEALHPVDAEKAGIAIVGTIKPPELSSASEDASVGGETPVRKQGSDRSTRESVKKESSGASRQSLTSEAAMRASTLAKVESKQDAARAAIINGSDKSEKKKKKKDKSTSDGSQTGAKSKDSVVTSSTSSYAQAVQRARSPSPSSQRISAEGARSKAPEMEAPEWATRLIGQVLQQPASASPGIATPDLKKLEENISVQFSKHLSTELESLHKRIDDDNRIQAASSSAKQDAVLRLVSSTLSENVERSLQYIVSNSLQSTVLPKLVDTTTATVSNAVQQTVQQTLNKTIPTTLKGELQSVLSPALSVTMQSQQTVGIIVDALSRKVAGQFEAIAASSLSAALGPALNSFAVALENRFAEQMHQVNFQRQEDAQKVDQLLNLVSGLAGTVQAMAASQESFQRHMAGNDEVPSYSAATGSASGSGVRPQQSRAPPQKSPEEQLQEEITQLMSQELFEEGTIMWMRSPDRSALFDSLFRHYNPTYLQRVSPLLALSTAIVVTDPMNNYLVERLVWLETVLNNVNPHDTEIRDVLPGIMEELHQRLNAVYFHLNETNPGASVINKVRGLVRRVNDINRLATGGDNVRR